MSLEISWRGVILRFNVNCDIKDSGFQSFIIFQVSPPAFLTQVKFYRSGLLEIFNELKIINLSRFIHFNILCWDWDIFIVNVIINGYFPLKYSALGIFECVIFIKMMHELGPLVDTNKIEIIGNVKIEILSNLKTLYLRILQLKIFMRR